MTRGRVDRQAVLFVDDLSALLRTPPGTIRRRVELGTFPIPCLPDIDAEPRWSGADFKAWLGENPKAELGAKGSRREHQTGLFGGRIWLTVSEAMAYTRKPSRAALLKWCQRHKILWSRKQRVLMSSLTKAMEKKHKVAKASLKNLRQERQRA